MASGAYVLPKRARVPLAHSQMSILSMCRRRRLLMIVICVFVVGSFMYFSSQSDTENTGSAKNQWSRRMKDIVQLFRAEDISNTANFIGFKGNRKGEFTFRKNPWFSPSKCPTSLQLKMAHDSWTSPLYHPEIHLLMNSRLLNQSEHGRLLPYYMPFGYRTKSKLRFKEILDVLQLFPARSSIFNFTDMEQPKCISCAVVGNGGILNGSRKGREIDMHSMVFRVNKAIRKGHEVDVGNRTTHYFFFDRSLRETSLSDVPNDQGMMKVFIPCRDMDYKYIRNVIQKKDPKIQADAKDVRFLHPDFVRYIHKIWVRSPLGSFRPTTGTLMLFTALHSGCDSVSVYGMGYNDNFTLYYYDEKFRRFKMDKLSHDTKSELKILKGLDKIGAINWYKRGIYNYFH